MGRGKKKRQAQGPNQGKGDGATGSSNSSWIDCCPAFRDEAEQLLRHLPLRKGGASAANAAGALQSKYPQSPLALHLTGHVLLEVGGAAKARDHLLLASQLEPNCLGIAFSLAKAHAGMEEFGMAADECMRALSVQNPLDPARHAAAVPQPGEVPDPDPAARVLVAKERLHGLLSLASALTRKATAAAAAAGPEPRQSRRGDGVDR